MPDVSWNLPENIKYVGRIYLYVDDVNPEF